VRSGGEIREKDIAAIIQEDVRGPQISVDPWTFAKQAEVLQHRAEGVDDLREGAAALNAFLQSGGELRDEKNWGAICGGEAGVQARKKGPAAFVQDASLLQQNIAAAGEQIVGGGHVPPEVCTSQRAL